MSFVNNCPICSSSDVDHDEVSGVSVDDHHSEGHSVVSHNDTTGTGAELDTLTDNSMADALHRHSELSASDGTPDQAVIVDATGNVGIGTSTPSAPLNVVGGMDIELAADDNITIDGRTNPREITMGSMRWNHTPEASTPNTRALFLDIDANSVPNTQGLHIDLKATDLQAGETVIGIDIVGDTVDSDGGVIRLLEFDKTGVGAAEVHAIHVEPEISEVIHHASGIFIDPTQGWIEVKIGGGFTNLTSPTDYLGSSANDIEIFSADDDAIYIGADAPFQEVEVIMNTGASNPGIKPTFEIWTGAAWTFITPIDNTAGFRESGIIDMEDVDLSSWAATLVNGVSKFYLRITRTQPNLTVDPIEDLIQTAAVTDYIWDGDGNVNLKTLDTSGNIAVGGTVDGIDVATDVAANTTHRGVAAIHYQPVDANVVLSQQVFG